MKFENPKPLTLSSDGAGFAPVVPAIAPEMEADPPQPQGLTKVKQEAEHDDNHCCVGRCVFNDALEDWLEPCQAEPTEDVTLKDFEGVPNDYVLHFCSPHGSKFRAGFTPESLN